jgi:hypothetical protein
MRIRLEVTLNDDRDTGNGSAILEVIDPQGVVGPPRMGGITLVRIPFEPLQ